MTEVIRVFSGLNIKAIQSAYEVVRVTFGTPEHNREAKQLQQTLVRLATFWGVVPQLLVYMSSTSLLRKTIGPLSRTFETSQTYVSNPSIYNGTRLVYVVLTGTLPRYLIVECYLVRLWYRSQPLVRNLCALQGHKSGDCPNRDKCLKCGQSGHFARNCSGNLSSAYNADFPPLRPSSEAAAEEVNRVFQPLFSSALEVLSDRNSNLLKDKELKLLQN
ncbi:unnamed protein product [Porites evermanni]|uniref:CCHC-type domain-containing protein n=1 Tax=Porites evermanni TaxID=104178 RepID=A0ABN8LRC3_9CNID|nr:unnamed protein product [Porites evermanni]